MCNGVQVQEPGRIFAMKGRQKGSILVELAAACVLLMAFFFASIETVFLIRDSMYLHRLARDAAREAVITGSIAAGERKGRDLANMYFGQKGSKVHLEFRRYSGYGTQSVTCVASYPHQVFGERAGWMLGEWEVNLVARATFGWHDFT